MFFSAQKEMTEFTVLTLRDFFKNVSVYGSLFNKDYSILGDSFEGPVGEALFLTSASFPEGRRRYFPSVTVNCPLSDIRRLSNNHFAFNRDEFNAFGKPVPVEAYKTAQLFFNCTATVRAKDRVICEEVSDLIAFFSLHYGYEKYKYQQYNIEPATTSGITTENINSSEGIKVYKTTVSFKVMTNSVIKSEVDGSVFSKAVIHIEDI